MATYRGQLCLNPATTGSHHTAFGTFVHMCLTRCRSDHMVLPLSWLNSEHLPVVLDPWASSHRLHPTGFFPWASPCRLLPQDLSLWSSPHGLLPVGLLVPTTMGVVAHGLLIATTVAYSPPCCCDFPQSPRLFVGDCGPCSCHSCLWSSSLPWLSTFLLIVVVIDACGLCIVATVSPQSLLLLCLPMGLTIAIFGCDQ